MNERFKRIIESLVTTIVAIFILYGILFVLILLGEHAPWGILLLFIIFVGYLLDVHQNE